jgi:hypothetical protein
MRVFDTTEAVDRGRLERDDYLGRFQPAEPLLIAHGSRIQWRSIDSLLASVAGHAGDVGAVLYYPWSPESSVRSSRFRTGVPNAVSLGREQLAILPVTQTFPRSALDLRNQLGGPDSGVWLIGSGNDQTQILTRLSSPATLGEPMTGIALASSDILSFILAFDENDQSILLARQTAYTRPGVDALKAALTQMQ